METVGDDGPPAPVGHSSWGGVRASPRRNERHYKLSVTNPYNPMEATEVYKEMETTTILREPQPPYEQNGEAPDEAKPSSGTLPAGASGPRPVTAATARRRRLWAEGTLILEDPFDAYEITEITEGWVARTEPNDPELEPQALELFPERTLVFAPTPNDGGRQCDHEWQKDSRVIEPERGHGHPAGSAPAEREQLPDRCAKCGAKRTEISESESGGHKAFDEIDTKNALWHVRSALKDAECIKGRPILKMGIERDLRHATRLLEDHAERNGFDV